MSKKLGRLKRFFPTGDRPLSPAQFQEAVKKAVLSHSPHRPERIQDKSQDVLTFLQTAGQRPNPVQRFILKLVYKIPLDDKVQDIEIWDRFREKRRAMMSELEYFHFLKEEGRLNLPKPDSHLDPKVNPFKYVLPWGRRGGKSVLCGFILAFEVYLLLHYYSPHDFFGIVDTEEIRIMSISTSEANATFVKNYAIACIDGHPFFEKYKLEDNVDRLSFATQKMLDRSSLKEEQKERPGIVLATYPCNERAVRGSGNMIIVYDEIAHYIRSAGGTSSVMSDESVVGAASPSQARFHKDENIFSKTFYISDPLDEAGVFYEEFQAGFENEDGFKTHICARIPTVEANPIAVTPRYLREELESLSEKRFDAAYGAKFTLGATSFVEDESWLRCFDPNFTFRWVSRPHVFYYCGIDLGFKRDKTAISIVHRTNTGQLIQDLMLVYFPHDFEDDQQMYEVVVRDLKKIHETFQPRFNLVDQHEGKGLTFACSQFGMKIQLIHMTELNHSKMSQTFRSYLRAQKFITARKPDNESFFQELIHLRKIDKKHDIIRVEKSTRSYDDEYDATIRSVWAAVELEEKKNRGVEEVEFRRSGVTKSAAAMLGGQVASGVGNGGFRKNARGGYNRWGQRRGPQGGSIRRF